MSIETDYATLRRTINEYDPQGWAVEFGVFSGYSLDIIARYMPVIGFDSFEGLPEDWRPGFSKGAFHTGRTPLPHTTNAMLIKGWFEDTVPMFPFPPLGLVHIDCDIYSSTVTALDAVAAHVHDGTLIVFDEYHNYPGSEEHEEKAFKEWIDTWDFEAELLMEGAEEAAFILSRTGTA